MTETIAQHMTPAPHCIGQEQTLAKAAEFMRSHHVRHLPVLHGGELVGVLSDRDIVLMENAEGVDATAMTVEDAMSGVPYAVVPQTALKDVLRHMAEHHIGSAIVAEHGHVKGIFTSMDAVRLLADLK